MGISDVAASGFGAGADDYERGRPGYSPDTVAWLVRELGIGPGTRVADLAAGTGKLTRLLPERAAVTAIEPVAAMRAKIADVAPWATVVDGTAEAIPLDDDSLDAVTVAQAFHWFDPGPALAEIDRVLRPGGGLAIVFNERDTREGWVAELSHLIRWDERGRWRVPYMLEVDWPATIATHGDDRYGPVERFDTTHRQEMDADTLVERVLSTSYLATLPEPERDALAARVRELVAPLPERFELPHVTVGFVTRTRPR